MFKNITIAAISSLATLFSHAGYAEHVYVGASYALLDGCSTEITDDASIRSGYGRIGAYFNESISAEIRGERASMRIKWALMKSHLTAGMAHTLGAECSLKIPFSPT